MHIRRRLFLLPLLLLAFAPRLHAQVKVEMGFERRLWVLYEPIPITVAITNLSGHDLHLADSDTEKWFSFQVTQDDGPNDKRVIAPLDVNYKLSPLVIPVGATVKTRVNLSNLYEVQDIGLYRFKATVYDRD
ncbi:MAG TPA: hypothetical protein VG733_00340, partial [Chthoniobacteraceae bacterium]|nr:hypothetical protein [Chthoniobacteraceae bacterium]